MSHEWIEILIRVLLGASVRAFVVAGAVALILTAFRVRSSGMRHGVWTAVLLVMLLMPVLPHLLPPIPIPAPVRPAAIQGGESIRQDAAAVLSGSGAAPSAARNISDQPSASAGPRSMRLSPTSR